MGATGRLARICGRRGGFDSLWLRYRERHTHTHTHTYTHTHTHTHTQTDRERERERERERGGEREREGEREKGGREKATIVTGSSAPSLPNSWAQVAIPLGAGIAALLTGNFWGGLMLLGLAGLVFFVFVLW